MTNLGKMIRAKREALGMSQAELARRASAPGHPEIKQQTIDRLERGLTEWSRAIPQVFRVLGLDEKLAEGAMPPATPNPIGPTEMPIMGVVDLDGDEFEMTGVAVRTVARPAALTGVPGVYAIHMRGASMAPMYRSADLLIIDPHQPPRPEDGALFLCRERDKFHIGEFVRETPTEWIVERWGDRPVEFKLKKNAFPICKSVYSVCKHA